MKKQLGRYTIEDVKVIASPFWDMNDDCEEIVDEDEIVDGILIVDTDNEFEESNVIGYNYSTAYIDSYINSEEELEKLMRDNCDDFSTYDHIFYKDENDKEGIYLGC